MTSKNTKWSRDDVEKLYEMSINNCSMGMMCRDFKRSRRNVRDALRWIQMQQAIFHPISDVAALHNTDVETLENRLKDPIFYVDVNTDRKSDNGIPLVIIATSVAFGLISLYGRFFCSDIYYV